MRTIPYLVKRFIPVLPGILTPGNMDDCFDYSNIVRPSRITLEKLFPVEIPEEYLRTELWVRYNWTFPELDVFVDKKYGGVINGFSNIEKVVANANSRLQYDISRIKELHVPFSGYEQNFSVSMLRGVKND